MSPALFLDRNHTPEAFKGVQRVTLPGAPVKLARKDASPMTPVPIDMSQWQPATLHALVADSKVPAEVREAAEAQLKITKPAEDDADDVADIAASFNCGHNSFIASCERTAKQLKA